MLIYLLSIDWSTNNLWSDVNNHSPLRPTYSNQIHPWLFYCLLCFEFGVQPLYPFLHPIILNFSYVNNPINRLLVSISNQRSLPTGQCPNCIIYCLLFCFLRPYTVYTHAHEWLRTHVNTPGGDAQQGKPPEVYGQKPACQIRHFREWKGIYVRNKVILRCN